MAKSGKDKASKSSIVGSNKLNRTVYQYCGEIVNRKILQRKERCKKQKGGVKAYKTIWDYPAMASCCMTCSNSKLFKDYSKTPIDKNFIEPLRSELINKLGVIGKKNNYIVGRCAEQQVANTLLKKVSVKLDDIYFSVAMRPRTRQEFTPCTNCSTIFKNVR